MIENLEKKGENVIVAIDFDGTIVEDQFPEVGKMIPGSKENINRLYFEGYTIIIWTCRTHIRMLEAVEWLAKNGIKYHYINTNCKKNVEKYDGSDPRKISADIYIDDRGLMHPLPHWNEIHEIIHERVPTYADKVGRDGQL